MIFLIEYRIIQEQTYTYSGCMESFSHNIIHHRTTNIDEAKIKLEEEVNKFEALVKEGLEKYPNWEYIYSDDIPDETPVNEVPINKIDFILFGDGGDDLGRGRPVLKEF